MNIFQSDEIVNLNLKFENNSKLDKSSFAYEAQIGSGAFGKVYRVRSKTTEKKYALKVLSIKQITHLKLIKQLENEIKILIKCQHPNIIKVFAVFQDTDYIYILMELAQDGNLFLNLRKNKSFSENKVRDYIIQVIKVLIYLHSQDPPILHRDLKPENILLQKDTLRICDFGWSNVNDDIRNTFCGTPDYLSPEMILGTGHDQKLDVWTVGVLMYELLYGQTPFKCNDQTQDKRMQSRIIEKNILQGNINFNLKPISPEAKNAISTMLNPDKDKRPYAKDLLNLQFFSQKTKQIVHQKSIQAKIHSQRSRSKNFQNDDASKNILEDLQQLLQEKDKIISEQQQEIQILKEVVGNKSIQKNIQKNNDQQAETINYMFNQTKKLSTAISEFYRKEIEQDDLNITKNNVLSYQSAKQKLDRIFQKFRELKTEVQQPELTIIDEDDEDIQTNKPRSMLPLSQDKIIKNRSDSSQQNM